MPADRAAAAVPELTVPDASAWRGWLALNHTVDAGVWLVLARKGTTSPTRLSYAEALEEALAHGWIDGQARGRDSATFVQRFTPRRKRSVWSKRNTLIAERLIDEGRMHAAGLAEVERARNDGRWSAAYSGPATIEVPPDLAAEMEAHPMAKDNFSRLTAQNRYAILYRLHGARRPETRATRIAGFIEMLERGETVYPQRRPLSRRLSARPAPPAEGSPP